MEPYLGGVRVQTYPTSKEEVHQQRVVPDSGRVKSAERSPRAKRKCINKEWSQTLVGSRVAGKEGVHQQRVVSDFGGVKVQS